MTLNDAIKTLLDLFPNMDWAQDNNEQVVIYTGMKLSDEMKPSRECELVPMDGEENE